MSYRTTYEFEDVIAERQREFAELATRIAKDMAEGTNRITARMKNPRGMTTPPAVAEAALKKGILEKLDHLRALVPEIASTLLKIHMDAVELGLFLDARTQAAKQYWARLADGKVYAHARQFLDTLWCGGIDAAALASLNQEETASIQRYIQLVLDKKSSG